MFQVGWLPFPWPPGKPCLIVSGEFNTEHLELFALIDGRFRLTVQPPERSFLSQPVDINSSEARMVLLEMVWTPSELSLRILGIELLPDSPGVPTLLLPPNIPVPDEISLNDPNASVACQQWIQNRKAKFTQPPSLRPNRRAKTVDEQAVDLQASIFRLKVLSQQTRAGHDYLLGTLAGEMRASVCWARDAQPERMYNPLLLRMASLADLPLPVYRRPEIPAPSIIDTSIIDYEPLNAPQIKRATTVDEVCDVQESLTRTVLRLGPSPGRVITALELIKELAHTMGASHYDEDASEFLDFLYNMKTAQGNQVKVFMCHTAEALALLSEYVLSELKTRNLIT